MSARGSGASNQSGVAELAGLFEGAATRVKGVEPLLAALQSVNPLAAAGWLADNEQLTREECAREGLSNIVQAASRAALTAVV